MPERGNDVVDDQIWCHWGLFFSPIHHRAAAHVATGKHSYGPSDVTGLAPWRRVILILQVSGLADYAKYAEIKPLLCL